MGREWDRHRSLPMAPEGRLAPVERCRQARDRRGAVGPRWASSSSTVRPRRPSGRHWRTGRSFHSWQRCRGPRGGPAMSWLQCAERALRAGLLGRRQGRFRSSLMLRCSPTLPGQTLCTVSPAEGRLGPVMPLRVRSFLRSNCRIAATRYRSHGHPPRRHY